MKTLRSALLGLAVAASLPVAAVAQDSTCPYDRCALRFHHSAWSMHLVAGQDLRPVASLSVFNRTVSPLAQARDSLVRAHYAEYRQYAARSTGLTVAAVAFVTAGFITYYADRYSETNQAVGAGLLAAGFVLTFPATSQGARAGNALQAAIWQYNRGLPR